MSVVERALKKLQQANGGQAPRPARVEPLGRVVPDPRGDEPRPGAKPSGGYVELDFDALLEAGLYAGSNSQLADEYRAIKRPLLKKAMLGEAEGVLNTLVMVASALPGEGKTFTSVNLCLSLAREKDWEVLLVDTDCRNPQLSRLFGTEGQPGFLDLIKQRELEPEACIMTTNVEGLYVLPAGAADDQSAEWLASGRTAELCRALASASPRRIVVFDSSPLLLTADAAILSGLVGQVVMVVHANRTPQNAVLQAVEKIDPSRSIGLVLNRAEQGGDLVGYGYPYGSGSAAYYSPSSPAS